MTTFKISAQDRNLDWVTLRPVTMSADWADARLRSRPAYEAAKRLFDVASVVLLSIIAIPLVLIAFALIKSSSRGPLIYRHTRVGRYGRPFTCYKLRTMVDGADTHLQDATFRERFCDTFKLDDDPRVTTVGRFLRRTSLDELPQLWNVLLGQMSLVGPRPVVEDELREKYGSAAEAVVAVLPGITGLWQVSGRSAVTYPDRVALDMEYLRRRSFTADLWILLRTPIALLLARGAC